MPDALPDGLYEHLVTAELAAELAKLEPARGRLIVPLDPADAHEALAQHVAEQVTIALESVPASERPRRQVEVVNGVLQALRQLVPEAGHALVDVASAGEELQELYRGVQLARPATPLAVSTLLTRNRFEPSLGAALAREIESADRIDVLVAFITVGGLRALRPALEAFAKRVGREPERLRVLTTVFTGTTELEAVRGLAQLPGATVKVSYDVQRTRLHAKAWLLHRASGLHTAYVGSANLTATALGSGQEWMVRASARDLPHVVDKFAHTFESLWNDGEFEPFDPRRESDVRRLSAALQTPEGAQRTVLQFYMLRPYPFQEEILDRLEAERVVHGRKRNLVVAATGTGKTVVAAFDYARFAERSGLHPRLLFVAHREELLAQARDTFRQVLRSSAFGELLSGGEEPVHWQHVFATIQSLARRDIPARFGADYFRYVVIDECHHAPADSYQALVPRLTPELLLGLTATPERADGRSLLPEFGSHIAAELRLWHALERQLVVPFEYYGVSDGTDLRRVRMQRGGYELRDLANVYTGNEARVDLVVAELQRRVSNVRAMRALAFCVSVEHAEYMAQALSARGIPAQAVHGQTLDDERGRARERLETRQLNVLCTCDLYNEGVDLPFVDTLLFLRPTESAALFLQQLGRGLRLSRGKASCLVLDFIGHHRAEFRFDPVLCALTNLQRHELAKAADAQFPYLPSGCVLQLDPVAQKQIVASLRTQLRGRGRMVEELETLRGAGTEPTLAGFLAATGRELEEVYLNDGSWTSLRRQAGVIDDVGSETEERARKLSLLLHVDEPARMGSWDPSVALPTDELGRRRYAMFAAQLERRGVVKTAEAMASYMAAEPRVQEELGQLREVLRERIPLASDTYPVPEWPLALHRHYENREILAAVGHVRPGLKNQDLQGGIFKLARTQRELLLVTLDKSGRSFSPSTRYRDFALSPSLFHWETQSRASASSESGRRYLESPANGWSFYLFVRTSRREAYAFVGPVHYVSHERDRPIAITWRLEYPLPALLFQRYATLAQG